MHAQQLTCRDIIVIVHLAIAQFDTNLLTRLSPCGTVGPFHETRSAFFCSRSIPSRFPIRQPGWRRPNPSIRAALEQLPTRSSWAHSPYTGWSARGASSPRKGPCPPTAVRSTRTFFQIR